MSTTAVPAEGEAAPDFELPDQSGEQISLTGLRGEWVVLYFYPRADTPGCTTQACGVRDRSGEYGELGARVLGVSPDEVDAVAKFDTKHDLGFTLLADSEHEVAERYGTWMEKNMYGNKYMGVQRSTFLIDPEGEIARIFPKVQPKKHDDLVLKALRELQA